MAIVNLRKHYYPLYTKDTFVEVPDEVAAVMEECRLYENRQEGRKSYYHVYSKVETIYVMANQDTWNKLSEEQQEIISTAFKNARKVNNDAIEQQTVDGVAAFAASGGTVIREDEIDSAAFAACVSRILESKYPYLLDIYTEIQAVK